jgi:diaminopimelate epimerase
VSVDRFPFVKGHGTENDFVLLPDPDGTLHSDLDAATVRRLTDRHSGLAADGVIRVVRSAARDEAAGLGAETEWFMDYRNADGSIAEMCGNGVRVMARYLWSAGLVRGPVLQIGTRAGVRTVYDDNDGSFTVDMGRPERIATKEPVKVTARWPVPYSSGTKDAEFEAVAVSAPNPHAVAFVADLDLVGLLLEAPGVEPEGTFPDGANVEFVDVREDHHIAMRVWERGVGETRSCGTGVCAAAWAAMERDGAVAAGASYAVDVPGGRLRVTVGENGRLLLTGPAELGVAGEIDLGRR